MTKTILDKIFSRLGSVDDCWTLAHVEPNGYGRVYPNEQGKRSMAHRAVYDILVGPIPVGLQLDHLCRNRACVNPDHLEPVTPGQNLLRSNLTWATRNKSKTHCKNGHEFTDKNIYRPPGTSKRHCKECRLSRNLKYRRAARG